MPDKKLPSTQSHLDIEDIQSDLVLLKNGNIALVLETNSLNFELLAEEEQDARILSFAALLNALTFSIQIVIRTERTDVGAYLLKLGDAKQAQASPALQKQIDIYMRFIQNLTTKTEVLKKRFFVVVTTNFASITTNQGFLGPLLGKPAKPPMELSMKRATDYLYPKRDFLIKQFKTMGLTARQLKNSELIQLYYEIYDPDKVGVQRVALDEPGYTTGIVEPLVTGSKVNPTQAAN